MQKIFERGAPAPLDPPLISPAKYSLYIYNTSNLIQNTGMTIVKEFGGQGLMFSTFM